MSSAHITVKSKHTCKSKQWNTREKKNNNNNTWHC